MSEIEQKISQFIREWPSSRWGPAKSVLEGRNLSDINIGFCLRLAAVCLDHDDIFIGDLDAWTVHVHRKHQSRDELLATVKLLYT